MNAAKTHCLRGHEFDERNTRFKKRGDGSIRRECRRCDSLAKMAKRKGLAA